MKRITFIGIVSLLTGTLYGASTIGFSSAATSGSEGSTSASITLTLDATHGSNITVNYTVNASSTAKNYPTSYYDFSLSNGTATIYAGDLTTTIDFTVVDDDRDEEDETVVVDIYGQSGGLSLGTNQHTYTITDDDDPPSVAFSVNSSSRDEASYTYVAVSLSKNAGSTVTIDWAINTGAGTVSGSDYNTGSGMLTFTEGQSSGTINVYLYDDGIDEPDETLALDISNPSNATLGGITSHVVTVLDINDPPEIDFSSSSSTENEAVGTVNVLVSQSAQSGYTTSMNYTVSGTATGSGTDHNLGSGTVTFPPGDQSETISFTITNDIIDETNETIILTLTSTVNASIGADTTHTITITDDDAEPFVDFDNASSSGGEGSTPATLSVSLTAESGKTVSVNYAVTGGTATGSGTDYTLSSGVLTFPSGVTSQSVSAIIVDDVYNESNETFIVTLSNPSFATLGTNQTHTYTITDNDVAPTVGFTTAENSVTEDAGDVTVNVELSSASGTQIEIDYVISGGTATSGGEDYTITEGTLTFSAGITSQSFTVSVENDTIDENSETIILSLQNPSNVSLGDNTTHTMTITDNDLAPTIAFSDGASSGAESNTSVTLTVQLSTVSGLPITVDYGATGGTATGGGTDYTLTGGTLSIPAGSSSTTFDLTVINDALDENTETVEITLSSPTNSSLGTNSLHTYSITDEDPQPTISFTTATGTGSEAVSSVDLTVQLSAVSGLASTVEYSVTGGTATESGTDFTLADGTATIAAGSTSATITLAITDDVLDEEDETIEVTLSDPVAASLGTTTVYTYTIEDNDDPPTIGFSAATSSVGEGDGTATVTVELSAVSGKEIQVEYSATGGTATGGATDYTLNNGTATIAIGETSTTFTVAIVDDILDEVDETIVMTCANPTNATLGTITQTMTIEDNDNPPSAQFTSATSTVSELTNTTELELSLSTASSKEVTIDYAVTGGTADGDGTDYTLASGTSTIAAGETITTISVSINNDLLDEVDETIEVTLSNPSEASLGANAIHTLTITDDDDPPTIAFSASSSAGSEGVAGVDLTVQLSAVSGLASTVEYSVTGGTATESGTDFTLADGTATIAAGSTSATITLAITDDVLDEEDETIEVTLSDPVAASLGTTTVYTYTIEDNDDPPTIGFSAATSSVGEGDGTATVTVELSAVSGKNISVNYSITGGSADGSGVDYTLSSGIATIAPGETDSVLTITIINDILNEDDETIEINLSSPVNTTLNANTEFTATITDNDPMPTISFTSETSSDLEAVTNVSIALELSAQSGRDISFSYAVDTDNSTATGGGIDYSLEDGSITMNAGETTASINIIVVNDNIDESDETIIVGITDFSDVAPGGVTSYSYSILDNDNSPEGSTVDDITTVGEPIVHGYWNDSNTGLTVTSSIEEGNASLNGGTLQILMGINTEDYWDIGNVYTIQTIDFGQAVDISIDGDDFENLPFYNQQVVVYIASRTTDIYGNSTIGTQSLTTVTIDTVRPDAFTVGALTTVGGNIIPGYWNGGNSELNVNIPVADDATLNGGTIQLLGAIGMNDFSEQGSVYTITGGDINSTIILSADEEQVESVNDFSDGENLHVSAILTDVAGNSRTGNESESILLIDQTSSTVLNVESPTSNRAYTVDDIITIQLIIDEEIYLTGGPPFIHLETGENDASANYVSGSDTDTLTFEYIVSAGDTSSDLSYLNDAAFNLNGSTIRDTAGNEINSALQTPGSSGSLSYNQNIVIDTEFPTCELSYPSDSLFRFEDGNILITATFSDSMDLALVPTITIDLPETASDISDAEMTMLNGSIWTYTLTQIADINGTAIITVSGRDKALNTLDAGDVSGGTNLRFDNVDPVFSATYPDTNAFINHKDIGWTLSEDLESGTITFSRTNGPGSTVEADLDVDELLQGTISPDEIENTGSLNLVSYTTYDLIFTGVDTAGNTGITTVPGLYYDIMVPSVDLTYTHEFVSADTVVTITATFTERILPTPTVSIDYAGTGDDVSNAEMTLLNDDSTTWVYDVVIPGGQSNNGLAVVSITAADLATNILPDENVTGDSTLIVDNTLPAVQLTYSDSLTAEGDVVLITADFSETMQVSPFPQLYILYAEGTEMDTTVMDYVDDTTYTYSVTIPDGNDGVSNVSIIAKDISGNYVSEGTTTGGSVLRVDNTHPVFTSLSPDSSAFINHTLMGYSLSETVESGTITLTRRSGAPDNDSPHIIQLVDEELLGSQTYEDYAPTDPTNVLNTLISGTLYDIAWSAIDSAGNTSLSDTYISTSVTYDTTLPNGVLTYTHGYASADTVVTITATFTERILPTPTVSIDYAGTGDDVSNAEMTLLNDDSTTWVYDVVIPGGQSNNGLAVVSITAADLATNILPDENVTGDSTLIVDNTLPTVTFVYENQTQPTLQNLGKSGDVIKIDANFNEQINATIPPTLNIQYADSTDDSFVGLDYAESSQGDSVWTYSITLPDSAKNSGTILASIVGKDLAGNNINESIDDEIFIVDNTPPENFSTGDVIPHGVNVVNGWINGITDSVEVVIPVIIDDLTEHLDIEMIIPLKMGEAWVTIGEADSIVQAGTMSFYRSLVDIYDALNQATTLAQGDTIYVRGVKYDLAGNRTIGDSSLTSLVYDPNAITLGEFSLGSIYTVNIDSLISSDTLFVSWTGFSEPLPTTASGLDHYEYAVRQLPDEGINNFLDWTSTADTGFTEIAPLVHNTEYEVYLRAFDVAGNISDTLSSNPILRWNSAPQIAQVNALDAFEDSVFTLGLHYSDLDFETLLNDVLSFSATTMRIIGDAAIDSVSIDENGIIFWNPTQNDTGSYEIEVIVADNWAFSDTMVFPLTVHAVNDTPTVQILSPDDHTQFYEDHTDTIRINLTQWADDVDNDSTELAWQAVILDSVSHEGYPLGQVIAGPGTSPRRLEFLTKQYSLQESDNPGQSPRIETGGSISVTIDTLSGLTFATFDSDSNYFGTEHQVIMFVSDPDEAVASDTILVTVLPENDPPLWSEIPRFTVAENDSFFVDFSEFVIDVDDTLLTFTLSADKIDTLTFNRSTFQSTGVGDTVLFKPVTGLISSHDSAHVQIIATDTQGLADTTSFAIDMIRIPRPHLSIAVVQNNAFSKYFEVIITDTMGTTVNPILRVQEQRVVLDTISDYTFTGHHDFGLASAGTYTFACSSYAVVGDTAITRQVGLTAAKILEPWSGRSPDGLFRISGGKGTAKENQPLLIVDSTMFNPFFRDKALYCIGNESMMFSNPVKITIESDFEGLAIYQRKDHSAWVELPSMAENGHITAYTKKMGYFRLGEKTLIVPESTNLHRNYPNPFNPVTTIMYDIGFSHGPEQQVDLSIYNLLGQKILTLVDGKKSIGRHTIQWHGVNTAGAYVSSGIYFVRLMTSSGVFKTQKIMLIR